MLVVSDLDGTLLGKKTPLSALNRSSFARIRELGGLSVIATGRSLMGAEEDLDPAFPIDYLIFSSGAGIYDWQKKNLLQQYALSTEQVAHIYQYLLNLSPSHSPLDFTIQLEAPNTHRFLFTRENHSNPDFISRLKKHQQHGLSLEKEGLPESASEFMIIQSAETGEKLFEKIKNELGHAFNVVRATSPLDSKSVWIEVFHPEVSKGNAAEWVRQRHDLPKMKTFALGNDYNDLQLLAWANNPLVVGDSAPELLEKYQAVTNHSESALAHALEIWLRKG